MPPSRQTYRSHPSDTQAFSHFNADPISSLRYLLCSLLDDILFLYCVFDKLDKLLFLLLLVHILINRRHRHFRRRHRRIRRRRDWPLSDPCPVHRSSAIHSIMICHSSRDRRG